MGRHIDAALIIVPNENFPKFGSRRGQFSQQHSQFLESLGKTMTSFCQNLIQLQSFRAPYLLDIDSIENETEVHFWLILLTSPFPGSMSLPSGQKLHTLDYFFHKVSNNGMKNRAPRKFRTRLSIIPSPCQVWLGYAEILYTFCVLGEFDYFTAYILKRRKWN